MKIISNIYSLRNSGPYLRNIGVEFSYMNTNVFSICEHEPNIIVTNNGHEAINAQEEYPNIIFIGKDLPFPSYDFLIPDALLDELTSLSKDNDTFSFPKCEIALSCFTAINNDNFIFKLKSLGNLKILGNALSIDSINIPSSNKISPMFYNASKVCAGYDKEEILKILFINKPCIVEGYSPYTYNINSVRSLNLQPIKGQVMYAWQYSHTNLWAELFNKIGYTSEANDIKSKFALKGTQSVTT